MDDLYCAPNPASDDGSQVEGVLRASPTSPAPGGEISPGSEAVLVGLTGMIHLNGTRVVVRHFVTEGEGAGRYVVKVTGQKPLAIRRENLQIATPAAAAASATAASAAAASPHASDERLAKWNSVERARRHIGRRVNVYWDFEKQWFSGEISEVAKSVSEITGGVRAHVRYDDGESRWEKLWEMDYDLLGVSEAGPSGAVKTEVIVKQEEDEGGKRRSGRVAGKLTAARLDTATSTKALDAASRLVLVELHCGTARLSRAAHVNHGCIVKMLDIKNVVEWDDQFKQGDWVTFEKMDIDKIMEVGEDRVLMDLLRGAHILWVAPPCTRMSNQTAGEEQRSEARPTGHGGVP